MNRAVNAQRRLPSVCIVSHNAWGAMAGGSDGHIGGVERQTSFMARWLAARGYPVSLLTWDEGQGPEVTIDGVRVIGICPREAGLPGLRFLHPRWTGLNEAMRRANADVYYHNCGEYITGQVALWCRLHAGKFVYSVASDPDCDPRLPLFDTARDRIFYRYGIRRAARIIVQTRRQQNMLREGFGLSSVVIPMPCPGPSDAEFAAPQPPSTSTARVLWVGRPTPVKRLELLLDVAETCPDVPFSVVCPQYDDDYSHGLHERAARLPNVTMHGPMPRERMPDFYRSASVLCCTSIIEGFPNTFLEAWSYGTPVVTTFDPDGLVAARGMGAFASDAAGLVAAVRQLTDSPQRWLQASQASRAYYSGNHAVNVAMPQFERVFQEVAQGGARLTSTVEPGLGGELRA